MFLPLVRSSISCTVKIFLQNPGGIGKFFFFRFFGLWFLFEKIPPPSCSSDDIFIASIAIVV